ncbi:MAG: DNRLRE domain-containing protein [Bacteroidia bacterium]
MNRIKPITILIVLTVVSLGSCKDKADAYVEHTVTFQPPGDVGKDALLWTELPDRTDGNSTRISLMAGSWYSQGFDTGLRRSMLEFDLNSIPQDAEIVSAKLTLYNYTRVGQPQKDDKHIYYLNGGNEFYIERITKYWEEDNVTWNNQPSSTTNGRVLVASTSSEREDKEDIDLTEMVRYWLLHPSENHGIMLKLLNETTERSAQFASSDHSDPAVHPKLVVVYKD